MELILKITSVKFVTLNVQNVLEVPLIVSHVQLEEFYIMVPVRIRVQVLWQMVHALMLVHHHIIDSLISNVDHVIQLVKHVLPIHHVQLVKMISYQKPVSVLLIVELDITHSEECVLLAINHVNHVIISQLNVQHAILATSNLMHFVWYNVLMELI